MFLLLPPTVSCGDGRIKAEAEAQLITVSTLPGSGERSGTPRASAGTPTGPDGQELLTPCLALQERTAVYVVLCTPFAP